MLVYEREGCYTTWFPLWSGLIPLGNVVAESSRRQGRRSQDPVLDQGRSLVLKEDNMMILVDS